MPSDFHIPLPSVVPFAHSQISFIHGCIYSIFQGSPGTASFFPSFRFPVNHNFWQSRWVHSLDMTIPYKFFPGYDIQYHILRVHFSSNILIRFFCLVQRSLLIVFQISPSKISFSPFVLASWTQNIQPAFGKHLGYFFRNVRKCSLVATNCFRKYVLPPFSGHNNVYVTDDSLSRLTKL